MKSIEKHLAKIKKLYPDSKIKQYIERQELIFSQIFQICQEATKNNLHKKFAICEIAISYATNNDDLIQLGKLLDNPSFYEKIAKQLKLNYLSKTELLSLGFKANESSVWVQIIQINLFNKKELLLIGSITESASVWFKIIIAGKFTYPEIIKIFTEEIQPLNAMEGYKHYILAEIIESKKFNNDELFELGNIYNNFGIWRIISKKLQLEGLNEDELFGLCEKSNFDFYICVKTIEIGKLNNEQLIEIAHKAKDYLGKLLNAIVENLKIDKLSQNQIIELVKKFPHPELLKKLSTK